MILAAYWTLIPLVTGLLLVLLLEQLGLPAGYRRTGRKPHLLALVLFAYGSAAVLWWQAPLAPLPRTAGLLMLAASAAAAVLSVARTGAHTARLGPTQALTFILAGAWLSILTTDHIGIWLIALSTARLAEAGLTAHASRRGQGMEGALKHVLAAQWSLPLGLLGAGLFAIETGGFHVAGTNDAPLVLPALVCIALMFGPALLQPPVHWLRVDLVDAAPLSHLALLVPGVAFTAFAGLWPVWQALGGHGDIPTALGLGSGIGMLALALQALDQERIERLLVYLASTAASVSLAVLLTSSTAPVQTALLRSFWIAVLPATLGAAAGLGIWDQHSDRGPTWESLGGAGLRSPTDALAWLVCLLAVAGAPLTASFGPRLSLLSSLWTSGQEPLAALLGLGQAIAVATVLRLAVFLFDDHHTHAKPARAIARRVVLWVCALLSLALPMFV